jgi:hypothetical protein
MEVTSSASRSGRFAHTERNPSAHRIRITKTQEIVKSVVVASQREEVRTKKLTNTNQELKSPTSDSGHAEVS